MKDIKKKDQKVQHRDRNKTGFEELNGKRQILEGNLLLCRLRTHLGIYRHLIIRIPGLEIWNMSLFLVRFSAVFIFVRPLNYCQLIIIVMLLFF